jgi:hypothetical protein
MRGFLDEEKNNFGDFGNTDNNFESSDLKDNKNQSVTTIEHNVQNLITDPLNNTLSLPNYNKIFNTSSSLFGINQQENNILNLLTIDSSIPNNNPFVNSNFSNLELNKLTSNVSMDYTNILDNTRNLPDCNKMFSASSPSFDIQQQATEI